MKKYIIIINLLMLILIFSNYCPNFSQTLPKFPNVEKEKIPKLEYQLNLLYQDFKSLKKLSSEKINYYKSKDILIINDKVKVEVHIRNPIDTTKIDFDLYEIDKDDYYGVFQNIVQMLLPIKNIKKLSEEPYVLYICVPKVPEPNIISEGVEKINTDDFHSAGYTGNGIKVAVIDLGFEGYEELLGTELPNNVITKSFYNSTSGNGDITGEGEVHGTAVAEIVHDVAPDAQLYFINLISQVELSSAVDYAISQGVNIINHSIGWYNLPYDGTGDVCDITRNAINNGILWINSAGNEAKQHYQGNFRDNGWHEFYDDGGETLTYFYVNAGETIKVYLSWNDWPYSSNDYDLYLMINENGTYQTVASSETPQTGSQNPTETINYTTTEGRTYYLTVYNNNADGKSNIEIFSVNHELPYISDEASYKSSIADPASADEVLAVGATNIYNILESYSSRGPTNDGRIKPDVMAPASVSNYTYGIFSGTSASAPHVAGAAALLLEQDPSRTNTVLKDSLESQTFDLGEIGKDNIYGNGVLSLSVSGEVESSGTEVCDNIITNTTWTKENSPYVVIDDIQVYPEATLTIEPGVNVKFKTNKSLIIGGTLIAKGAPNDSIYFLNQEIYRWGTIKFIDSSVDAYYDNEGNYVSGSIIEYASIEGAVNSGIYCEYSSPFIHKNLIINNLASDDGGGIYCYWGASPKIYENKIIYNVSGWRGGGIYCGVSSPIIKGNIIANNIAHQDFLFWGKGGGIYVSVVSSPTITGNIISNNTSDENGGGIHFEGNTNSNINYNNISANNPVDIYAEENLNATNNWWGTNNKDLISLHIYDYWDDMELGEVHYEPFLTSATPINISSIKLKTDNTYSANLITDLFIGDNLFIELVGIDGNSTSKDSTNISIISSSDNTGIEVVLTETGINTGIYRGICKLGKVSDDISDIIFVSQNDDITIKSKANTSIYITKVISNRIPDIISFYPLNDTTITEGDSLLFYINAIDLDGDSLCYSWIYDNSIVCSDSSFKLITDYNSSGIKEIIINISDGIDTVNHKWNINIKEYMVNLGKPFTQEIPSDTGTIYILFSDNNSINLKFKSGSVAEKNITVTAFGNILPDTLINIPRFESALAFYDIESNILGDFSADLSFTYTDSILIESNIVEDSLIVCVYDSTDWRGFIWHSLPVGIDKENNKIKIIVNHFSLQAIVSKNEEMLVSLTDEKVYSPKEFNLYQNYPNPFNSETHIKYEIPKTSKIEISIYNILGQKVKTLLNEIKNPGFYEVVWNGTNEQGVNVSSGVYLYVIKTKDFFASRKMIFLR